MPIAGPDQHHIEAAAAGIDHQLIEPRPAGPGAGDLVGVLVHDLVAALLGQLAQIVQLAFRVLVQSRHPQIQRGALHALTRTP